MVSNQEIGESGIFIEGVGYLYCGRNVFEKLCVENLNVILALALVDSHFICLPV